MSLLHIFHPVYIRMLAFVGKEMDLRNTIKNGIMYLEDPVDKDWNPHFFVLTQNKLFYTDSFHTEQETEGDEEEEEAGFHAPKEVTGSCERRSNLSEGCVGLLLSSYYKLEGLSVVLNIFNILQNLFIWNNGVTQCFSARHM
jgi:hypothetical protein